MAIANRLSFTFGAFLAGILTFSSCTQKSNVPQLEATPSPIAPTATPATPSPTAPAPTVTVKLYRADSQCAGFVSESVQVSKARSMEAAIGKVIAVQHNADFDLAGYRVKRGANGIATIDLRVAPNSKRQIVSLSNCERLALFGSIRETLLHNPLWRIKSVRFTDRGKNIVF